MNKKTPQANIKKCQLLNDHNNDVFLQKPLLICGVKLFFYTVGANLTPIKMGFASLIQRSLRV